ncbi:hypothetical protein GIB67_025843 [Kingdonia uniflora]|uniref:Flowering time control protein FCA n=1 Tax=Kingdonia uniflora TaxID=39325 RepID=A0A7J7PBR5_9MAGN|nr:hypothetical protein GIB67_025843 [Kingdonia uniflora]
MSSSRYSDSPHHHRNPNSSTANSSSSSSGGNYQRGGFSGGRQRSFDSPPPPSNYPLGSGGDGYPPVGGGGGGIGGFNGGGGDYQVPITGQKRGFPFSGPGRGVSPPDNTDNGDGGSFAKLFIGSVPRTATEEEIRPLFEQHGDVVEVALIKDKRTGQQQGCCFIKYATSEEADRAIRGLHNQYTLPGGTGPIQVRYADGERERLGVGSLEYKLFVGSLNKQASEKEIEDIFSPYGRVEDVYIMRDDLKQSRGCAFVKFFNRDMAMSAINALNGTYLMRGCDQPLSVRFADPKRPRGDSRPAPSFGSPGFGPRAQAPSGIRPGPNIGDTMGLTVPPSVWHPMGPQNTGPSPQTGAHGFGSQIPARGGAASVSSSTVRGGPFGVVIGGPTNGSLPGLGVQPPSSSHQTLNPSMSQIPSVGQHTSPSNNPLQSSGNLLPPKQLLPTHQMPVSYSQPQTSFLPMGQMQIPSSATQSSFNQPQQLLGSSGQVSASQPMVQQGASSAATQQIPVNLRPSVQLQVPFPGVQQKMLQPVQQPPTQLAQVLSQQTQSLQASFQSSQQAFSQLQQQLHLIQQNQNNNQQQGAQATKQQSPWTGIVPQTVASVPATAAGVAGSTTSITSVAPITSQVATPINCNWTEHTSPEGYKYYYNSVTKESRLPAQLYNQPPVQLQQPPQYQASGIIGHQNPSEPAYVSQPPPGNLGVDPSARYQQGFQASQDWMWKNKPAGLQLGFHTCLILWTCFVLNQEFDVVYWHQKWHSSTKIWATRAEQGLCPGSW